MSRVFHRQARVVPRVAASGDGVYITDTEGNKFLDASGGAAVSCLGHSHPKVLQAIREQINSISFAHTGFFTSKPDPSKHASSTPRHAAAFLSLM